jgi:hypothetical protein
MKSARGGPRSARQRGGMTGPIKDGFERGKQKVLDRLKPEEKK